ncbi:MAG TPA: DNA polymerase I [Candidatus Saccharimonadales bacterium]|nr:DNA polymerase I [Candidatus Saccharimonadales bacterium]
METDKISKKAVFIVDGSSFLYRAYYAMKPLYTSKGILVHALYGFCRMIKKLIAAFNIKHLVIVWDSKGTTHRHELFSEYKAKRQAPPSDIFQQKEFIQEFADLVGIAQLSESGKEADDLMYSFAKKANKSGYQAIIVSSDKDMRQALSDDILIFDPFREIVIDVPSCETRYGFEISKLPFYFAILGDTSDNIPGVKGIGEKGATELVKQFKNLDDMYAHLDQIPKQRTRDLLALHKDDAYLSEKLFLLHTYKVDLDVENTLFEEKMWAYALPLFQKFEMKSLIKSIEVKYEQLGLPEVEKKSDEIPLHEKYDFVLVNTLDQLIHVCNELKQAKSFAIDTETTGLDPMKIKVAGISVACKLGQAFYIPFGHKIVEQLAIPGQETKQEERQLSKEIVMEHLGPILKDPNIKKYMHNAKYDQLVLLQNGFEINGIEFDTMIAASLVTKEWEKNGLKELSKQFLHETMITYKDMVKKYKVRNCSEFPLQATTQYAGADAHQTLQLVPIFKQELENQNMHELYYDIEHPINDILVAMQQEGIYCDREVLNHLSTQVNKDLQSIEQRIYAVAGKEINLNSPKQVRELLFDALKLTPQKRSGSGTSYSTDAEVLAILALEHEVPQLMLAYRELYKLKSTYIDALPTYINPKTQLIHTSWNQTVAATGRLSSSNPNLQNIPKDGLQYTAEYDVDVRSAFKAKTGWTFIAADYSQIELRVLAHFSKDKELVNAFLSQQDIHAQTAAKMFCIDIEQVTDKQRNIGKRLNFSILYGLTAFGLSKDMNISYADAKNYIDIYFQQYPGVSAWMEGVVEFVKKNGYTQTLYGRRRYLPGIYEKNKTLYDLARRMAINTPAQGTAAEVTKLGMIAFTKAVAKKGLDAKILLQIHDELVVTCPNDQAEVVSKLLEKTLVDAVSWDVPLLVSIRQGNTWKDVTK